VIFYFILSIYFLIWTKKISEIKISLRINIYWCIRRAPIKCVSIIFLSTYKIYFLFPYLNWTAVKTSWTLIFFLGRFACPSGTVINPTLLRALRIVCIYTCMLTFVRIARAAFHAHVRSLAWISHVDCVCEYFIRALANV